MLQEEWRLHAELFGGRRFIAFPALIAALAAAGLAGLDAVDVSLTATIAGLHALVFFFGLQTGSVGLVGRDAIENLLGETTLLVFSGRTLPLSRRRLLVHFLLRDLVYYAGLFLLPLAVAVVPVAVLGGAVSVTTAPVLAISLVATFALGLAVTLAILALSARGTPGGLVFLGVVGIVTWLQVGTAVSPVTWSPYGFVAGTPLPALAGTIVGIGGCTAVGVFGYEPDRGKKARVKSAAFGRWRQRLGDDTGLVTKQLFDVARSAGGLWKVVFSGAILFAVSVGLLVLASEITGVVPSPGIAFGAVLSLSAFTTYNWLTSAADLRSYRHLPLSAGDVLDAAARSFALLGPIVALLLYFLGVLLVGPAVLDASVSLADLLVGVIVLVGFQGYLFGLTVWLAGSRPNEFLFDTLLFGGFTFAVSVPMIPVLIAGVALDSPSLLQFGAVALLGLLVAVVGVVLLSKAGSRWEQRLSQSG